MTYRPPEPEQREPTLRFGLRFSRRQAGRLRATAHVARQCGKDAEVFDRAAESAERGEPLEVLCVSRDEAEQIAAVFVLGGFERPVIDDLNG